MKRHETRERLADRGCTHGDIASDGRSIFGRRSCVEYFIMTLPGAEVPDAEVAEGGRTSANGHSQRVSCVGTLSALWPSISRSSASSAVGQRATQNSVCATVTAVVS